jgi:TfoX/Sxy family transcriptional regulator of competence genes
MPFSESLAARTRDALAHKKNIEERRMFGGLVFLLNGNMLVGVWKESLIARLGPDQAGAALREAYVREFDITGKPMKNWVMIEPEGVENDENVKEWIEQAAQFVETLPVKSRKQGR